MDNCEDTQKLSEECRRVSRAMSEANSRGCPSEARRIYYEWRNKQTWTLPKEENNEVDWEKWFSRDSYEQ